MDAGTAHARRWFALALLATTQFLIILDVTIVNIALPSIAGALKFSPENLTWVVNAYLLVFGGLLLLGGRLADLFGRRRMFVIGLLVFGFASLACGLAETSSQLIAFRALQGLGGALLSPAALSLLAATFTDGKELSRAFGVWGAVAGAGGATGVLLGGILSDGPGWEWVFWVAVPFTVVGALLAPVLLARSVTTGSRRHFDVVGALTVTLGLSALVYGLVQMEAAGVGSARALLPVAAAVVLLTAFVLVESRARTPLVALRIFRSRVTTAANTTMFLFAAAVVAMNFFVSLYLQLVLNFSPVQAGLAFLPMALGQIVFAQVAARVINHVGPARTLLPGLLVSAAGLAWFGMISPDGSYVVDVLGPAVVLSIGGAFTIVSIMMLALTGVEMRDTGLAGGLINMSQQVGGALGLALLATLAVSRTNAVAGGGTPDSAALNDGFRLGLFGAAALTLVAAGLAVLLLRGRPVAAAPAPAAEDLTAPDAVEPAVLVMNTVPPPGCPPILVTPGRLGSGERAAVARPAVARPAVAGPAVARPAVAEAAGPGPAAEGLSSGTAGATSAL